MKTLLVTFLLMTTFSFSSTNSDGRVDLSWLDGEWRGIGFQGDLSSSSIWDIHLTYKVIFQEKIEGSNADHYCTLSGKVIVTKINKKHISYSYFDKIAGKEELVAHSTLTKPK